MAIRAYDLINACAEGIHGLEQVRLGALGVARDFPWSELPEEAREALRNQVRKVLLGEVDRPRPDAHPGEELSFETILSLAKALGFAVEPFRAKERPSDRMVGAIKRVTAERMGQTVHAMESTDRSMSIALARHLAMYLCRTRLHMSTPEIGRAFGGRDPATVASGVKRIERDLTTSAPLREHLTAITAALDAQG